jgi:hypothetical protein
MTINQIINEYQKFCNKHLLIKTFSYMVPKDRFVTNNYKYPLVLIEPLGFDFKPGEIRFNHNLYFLDKVNKDLTNYMSIISNQLQIGTDLYNYFNDNEQDFGFFLYDDFSSIPVLSDIFEDWLCGVVIPITAQIQNPRTESDIPLQ